MNEQNKQQKLVRERMEAMSDKRYLKFHLNKLIYINCYSLNEYFIIVVIFRDKITQVAINSFPLYTKKV